MLIQGIIVGIIIVAAIAYAVKTLLQKRRSFSSKAGCEADCGCSGGSKKLPS